jgi:hypothetical protein
MSRSERNLRAGCVFIVILILTGIYDVVLAIEAGMFCFCVAVLIAHCSRWSKETVTPLRKVVGMSVGLILLFFIMFMVYLPVPMVCSLIAANYSNYLASGRLREVVIALHNYHQDMNRFPAPASYSASGQPLLSWRVHLLPYLGHEELYRQFHLDEPWDSPHNQTLLRRMPEAYRLPAYGQQASGGGTFIQLIVGQGAVFGTDKPPTLGQLVVWMRNDSAIIAGIAQHAVPWTKPADLVFEEGKPLALGRVVRQSPTPITSLLFGRGIHHEPGEGNRRYRFSMADGSIRSVVSLEELGQLGPLIRWKGPKPAEFDKLD